jgi:hypothetical protein
VDEPFRILSSFHPKVDESRAGSDLQHGHHGSQQGAQAGAVRAVLDIRGAPRRRAGVGRKHEDAAKLQLPRGKNGTEDQAWRRAKLTNRQVDTSALSLPSKLSRSAFLRDISKVSGQDYIGPDITPQRLGISISYTVHVFTCCGHATDTHPGQCTTPLVGSSFDPYRDLKLDNTILEGTYSSRMRSALNGYNRISPFLGAGFLVAFVLGLAAPTTLLLAKKAPRAAWVSAAMGVISTIFLLAATASAHAIMRELAHAMHAEFSAIGIRTDVGKLTYPAWAAFGFSVLATLSLVVIARRTPQRKMLRARVLKGKGPSRDPISKASTMTTAGTSQTVVNGIPPSRHGVPILGDPLPPRLPMIGGRGGDRSRGSREQERISREMERRSREQERVLASGAGFGVGGVATESGSSRRDSDMSMTGTGGSYNSHSSRISGGDKIISHADLSNTRRKELPVDPQSGYVAYRPLEGNVPRH